MKALVVGSAHLDILGRPHSESDHSTWSVIGGIVIGLPIALFTQDKDVAH